MNLSIIVPARNEGENISKLVHEMEKCLDIPHELIIVNDHSLDNTRAISEKLCFLYPQVRLIDNFFEAGFANAVRTGFDAARTGTIIPVMADLSDNPLTIKKMYEKAGEGFDIVCGSRYMKKGLRRGGSRIKAFFSGIGGRSLYYLLGLPTCDIANAFKLYTKKVIESLEIKSNSFAISMEIPLKAYYLGFRITEVPTTWKEREKGKSNFKLLKELPFYLKLYFWAVYKKFLCR